MKTMTAGRFTPPGAPEAEVRIDRCLVQELLRGQAPQWAELPVAYFASGWDNEIYRLGPRHLIRLPRRAQAERIGTQERAWLARLAADTGLTPGLALHVGHPTATYPFTFSIVPFVPGVSAAGLPRAERDAYAPALADYLRALHVPAPAQAPTSNFRGLALRELDGATRALLPRLPAGRRPAAAAIWAAALRAADHAGAPRWLHGDPHPHNTIVRRAAAGYRFAALVDFGDLCAGDPASDLGMLWLHFGPTARTRALERYGVSDGEDLWHRARGWALRYGLLLCQLDPGDRLGRIGRESLDLLLSAGR